MKIRRFLITLFLITPLLMAVGLMQEISPATMTAIAFIISTLVGLIGPKPLEFFIGRLGLEGQWAVLFTYLVAFGIGTGGLVLSKELFGLVFAWENALAIAGLLFAASTYAFHRLKGLGKI